MRACRGQAQSSSDSLCNEGRPDTQRASSSVSSREERNFTWTSSGPDSSTRTVHPSAGVAYTNSIRRPVHRTLRSPPRSRQTSVTEAADGAGEAVRAGVGRTVVGRGAGFGVAAGVAELPTDGPAVAGRPDVGRGEAACVAEIPVGSAFGEGVRSTLGASLGGCPSAFAANARSTSSAPNTVPAAGPPSPEIACHTAIVAKAVVTVQISTPTATARRRGVVAEFTRSLCGAQR